MAELQKREKVMVGAAGSIVVAFLLYQFVFTSSDAPPQQASTKKVSSKSNSAVIQKKVKGNKVTAKTARLANVTMDLNSWGRDPFREAYRLAVFDTSQTDSSTQLVLKGIIWKGNRAYVLINDTILRKGERMGDIKVLDIKKERVICKQGTNTVTLFLDGEK